MVRSPDSVLLADKDAVIYKLREHVKKTEEDKTNLTDQLLEVRLFVFWCLKKITNCLQRSLK